MSCWGPSSAIDLRRAASRWRTAGIAWAVAGDWLEAKRAGFPQAAAPATKRILDRLAGLAPLWAKLPENDAGLGEARRLLTEHLPRLVEAFARVPQAARAENPEVARGLVMGLAAVAEELDRMWAALTQESVRGVAVEGRFLETRYGENVPDSEASTPGLPQ